MRLVTELNDIARLMSAPSRVQDAFWFRNAVTTLAKPALLVGDDSFQPLWVWESGGRTRYQIWGDWFIDGEPWKFNESETLEAVDLLSSVYGEGRLGRFISKPPVSCIDEDLNEVEANCELRLRWDSFDEYARDVWDRKARGNHEREVRHYREQFRSTVEMSLSFKDYVWLNERSILAATKGGEEPVLRSGLIRASYWNLLSEFMRRGLLRKLVVENDSGLAALMVWMVDPYRNGLLLSFAHGLDSLPSIGKYMYECMVRFAIDNDMTFINGGYGFFRIKKHFRFERQPSYYVLIGEP